MSSPTTSSVSPSFRGSTPAPRPPAPAAAPRRLQRVPELVPMPAEAVAWREITGRLSGTGNPALDLAAGFAFAGLLAALWLGTLAAVGP